jgi:Ecdysteroid kinase-like family
LPPTTIVSDAVGYKLIESKRGRIKKHIYEFIGEEFVSRSQFLHNEQLLPNPFVFATGTPNYSHILRPLLGPVHGDCHAQNMFVRAGQDATVSEVYLIDLATYQQKSLFFFDHAYLELATMLRQMDRLGERRWLEFATALSGDDANRSLEPDERGWLEDILAARSHVLGLASKSYPDRMDDLKLQFLLAHVAAGLAFLHKVPRQGTGSGGLSASQYRQSFVWSAVFLRQCFNLLGLSVEQASHYEARVPVLGKSLSGEGPVPSAADPMWTSPVAGSTIGTRLPE